MFIYIAFYRRQNMFVFRRCGGGAALILLFFELENVTDFVHQGKSTINLSLIALGSIITSQLPFLQKTPNRK